MKQLAHAAEEVSELSLLQLPTAIIVIPLLYLPARDVCSFGLVNIEARIVLESSEFLSETQDQLLAAPGFSSVPTPRRTEAKRNTRSGLHLLERLRALRCSGPSRHESFFTGSTKPAFTHFLTCGDVLVSGCNSGKLHVWDMSTRNCRWLLEGHVGSITALALTTCGRHICSAAGYPDRSLNCWSTKTWGLEQTLELSDASSKCLACAGDLLAAGLSNGMLQFWSTEDWSFQQAINAHRGAVLTLASVDSTLICSGSSDRSFKVWCAKRLTCLFKEECKEWVVQVLPVHSLNVVLTIEYGGAVQVRKVGCWTTVNDSSSRLTLVPRRAKGQYGTGGLSVHLCGTQLLVRHDGGLLCIDAKALLHSEKVAVREVLRGEKLRSLAVVGDVVALGMHGGRIEIWSS